MVEEIKWVNKVKEGHSITNTVKELCIDRRISIPKLEKELGFGNGAIYHWDSKSPGIDKIIKVAIYFNVSADYILGLTNEE